VPNQHGRRDGSTAYVVRTVGDLLAQVFQAFVAERLGKTAVAVGYALGARHQRVTKRIRVK